ncbi:MAG TPA: hypothetical protein VFK44_09405 [Bacillales bacterium]|nr:hypothetical protein [Bacillales bacterium]
MLKKRKWVWLCSPIALAFCCVILWGQFHQYKTIRTFKESPFVIHVKKNEIGWLNLVKLKAEILYTGSEKRKVFFGENDIAIKQVLNDSGKAVDFRSGRKTSAGTGHARYTTHGEALIFSSERIHLPSGRYRIEAFLTFHTKQKTYDIPILISVDL